MQNNPLNFEEQFDERKREREREKRVGKKMVHTFIIYRFRNYPNFGNQQAVRTY